MKTLKLVVPPLDNNVYLIFDENGEAAIIDVALGADQLFEIVKAKNLKVKYIINTHGHIDHVAHNKKIKQLLPDSILVIHENDLELMKNSFSQRFDLITEEVEYQEPDLLLKGTEILRIGKIELHVIHTPGHTPGSICLLEPNLKILFSGDTLFLGTYGRTDLPGGDENMMIESLRKLSRLPKETIVYPGHGSETRIGLEYWLQNL